MHIHTFTPIIKLNIQQDSNLKKIKNKKIQLYINQQKVQLIQKHQALFFKRPNPGKNELQVMITYMNHSKQPITIPSNKVTLYIHN